jgi:hypothetical protein
VTGSYYDCQPTNTYNPQTAMEACISYTGNVALCLDGFTFAGTNGTAVCSVSGSIAGRCNGFCWVYSGTPSGSGDVKTCDGIIAGFWN